MTTFERYFIEDKASHKEPKNPYYYLREDVDMIRKMLKTSVSIQMKEELLMDIHLLKK